MTDEQLVQRLLELDAKGKDGIAEMRDVLRGQMSRLIALAARGIGAREIKARTEMVKMQIVVGFPDPAAKESAVSYWNLKRRPDLVARIEEIAEAFFNHHYARNSRFTAWNLVWATWYKHSVAMEKPPRDMPRAVADVIPLDLATWVRRLRIFHFGDDQNAVEVGYWSMKWGPPPGRPGCMAPPDAQAEFETSRQKSLRL